jgi:hypothetical protein
MEHDAMPPAGFGPDRLRAFPGPVVLAAQPDAGWRAMWGASEADGRPHEAHVQYRSAAPAVPLVIRTVLAPPIPPPLIGTVHNLYTTVLDLRMMASARRQTSGRRRAPTRQEFRALSEAAKREEAGTPGEAWHIAVDGVEFPGYRKDLRDCSVAEIPWSHGIRILCAGDAAVLDRLALRSVAHIP